MSFRQKIFLILSASQLFLVLILAITFIQMIDRVKNEPQDKRAFDKSVDFQKELRHKEETIRFMLKELERNSKTVSILESGSNNRSILDSQRDYFSGIMKQYDLSIFEVISPSGKVIYRFHRPGDFGDDKSKQKIVQEAFQGKIASTLELGHSGLGLRVTSPLRNGAVVLVGQVVDQKFTENITGSNDVHMAIYEKDKRISVSGPIIENYLENKNPSSLKSGSRFFFSGKHFYLTRIPYANRGLTDLDLEFVLLIDETELYSTTRNLWIYCGLLALSIFVGILLVSYLFSRDIINAVKALNFAMKNPGEDETTIIDLDRTDELGQMGEVFVSMKKELLEHQLYLERKVEEKTQELQETLNEVQALKEKQDGDYYLTSLLIQPLTSLRYSDDNTKIESVLKQKKEFRFRTKNSEIGGDLCSIQEITLMGKNYLAILNADAMGKSIQGAGGALVMGTVFKAIITRTQLSRSNQKKTPEKWLKDCYTELQNVFVTFDGSMLVSAVIALFDRETGALYSINAEHPWMVLYRDGKATFLDHELLLRKIGFTENAAEPVIRLFRLEPDDVLFIGSDGRDDLLLKKPDSSETFMNEDETLFLRLVELSNGELSDLEKLLFSTGEVTDDLSIMRIAYKTETETAFQKIPSAGDEYNSLVKEGIQEIRKKNLKRTRVLFEQALSISDADPGLFKQLARICIHQKDFPSAAGYAENYVARFPFDNEFLYYTSFSLRKTKEYPKAIEYAERLRSREPANLRNLKHLVELYRLVGNRSKFRSIMSLLKTLIAEKETKEEDRDEDVSSEPILA
ncbi:stage II sporulation protein E [Leptospira gomenensis]|uniref:Stage II sporulation protein E n=1 Tax=Leptospira gomenensis TaxID=2484974 RepID=A0A5F1YF29_9LEPT|nr:PP2C family protein-serine/threonine phosphatase [Leptospira gomenensis]TGK38416.1 stage II sporulation protein E [Leptospira gomenensis]TGK42002.1 stage II sporulation protein E [Leptospira gomenensis]TGK52230.1 stage II sporulation protein E [Leptospira gomenensis]TGK55783.1 stage II sporulation protein E [Leptospira gomenensis]